MKPQLEVAGRIDIAPSLNRIRFIIDEVLEEFKAFNLEYSESNRIELRNEVPEDVKAIVDVAFIKRAFRNIIFNAWRSMEVDGKPHGGVLTVKVEPSLEEDMVKIGFIDTGKGIPEQICEDIKAGRDYRRDGIKGNGLLIIQGVIEEHGGRFLPARREDQQGTIITITLPSKKKEMK
jgi:signal transduction histidine kinase